MSELLPWTWGFLTLVAAAVYQGVGHLIQDRGEPEAGPAPDALSDVRFWEGRFASLHAVGLLRWQPVPQNAPPWQRFLLVEFAQYCPAEELEQARQALEAGQSARYWDLTKPAKQVRVEIGLGANPDSLSRAWQRAIRNLEKRRFNPKKGPPPPDRSAAALEQEAHRFLQQDNGEPVPEWVYAALFSEPPTHHDALQPGWWRRFYMEPNYQTEEDICFLLALVLLQEGMVPEAEVEPMKNALADYLHKRQCLDLSTAYLVLDKLLRHFTEPQDWLGVQHYLKQLVFRTEKQPTRRRVFTERRKSAAEDANHLAVDDALARCMAEHLPASRSTLFRWTQAWALKDSLLAGRDADGALWLTREGLAEARKRLMLTAVTQLQVTMGKEKDAARKFTQRHKRYIQEAASRGDTLKALAEALLAQGNPLRLKHQRDSDT